jgi:PAS domain S-box-containing protein
LIARLRPYLVGIAAFAVASGVRLILAPYLGAGYVYLQFYPAVFVAAWIGGFASGATTAILSALSAQYIILSPSRSLVVANTGDILAEAVFVASGFTVSLIAEQRLRALAYADARQRERDRIAADNAALAEHATRYREWLDSLVADVPAVVWETFLQPDGSHQINYINRHVERMLGYRVDEWLGAPNFLVTIAHPDDRERIAGDLAEMFESGRGGTIRCRVLHKDGRPVWIEAQATVIVDEHGHPVAMRGVTLDITASIQLQAERSELLQRTERARQVAEDANRLKDEFLMTLSHELRTPINAIWGWARMLRSSHLDETKRQRAIEVIERNAQSQLHLIEDLLDVSRIVSGKLRLTVEPVDLASVVQAVCDTLRPAAEAKGIELQTAVDQKTGLVSGDRDRLEQAVWNVVANAVKFTPAGGRVALRLQHVASHAEIGVTDNGPGIDPSSLPVIFERFRQGDSGTTRAHTGLGLGLAIARSLIEAHGGTITAASDGPGSGSTFCIRLPVLTTVAEDVPEQQPTSPSPRDGAHSARRLDGVRVLVVDDEPDARELLEAVLRDAGAVVRAESSAADGQHALDDFDPAVLVSDIEMPGDDGYAFMRRIRAGESDSDRPLLAVALTAYAGADDRMRALAAGFHAHIGKPVDAAELTATIGSLLDLRTT